MGNKKRHWISTIRNKPQAKRLKVIENKKDAEDRKGRKSNRHDLRTWKDEFNYGN